jgi:hypothetical protein
MCKFNFEIATNIRKDYVAGILFRGKNLFKFLQQYFSNILGDKNVA